MSLTSHHQQAQPVSVVQLTDMHLGETQGEELLGMDTDASLDAVLEQLNGELPAPDLLLLTGDIASDGQRGAYQRIRQRLDSTARRCAWLPGNHDDPALMRAVDDGNWSVRRVDLGSWQVILLDSSVAGEVGGELASEQLDFLKTSLSEHSQQHALVCLHHHVLPIGCDWLDEQRVANHQLLLETLQAFPKVGALLSGHVHQASDRRYQQLRVLTSPSTCIQFAPNSADFALDHCNPGYRWLRLHADGRLETAVSRVRGAIFSVDMRASGY